MNIFIIFGLIAVAVYSVARNVMDRRKLMSHLVACFVILFVARAMPFTGLVLAIGYVVIRIIKRGSR